MKRYFALLTMFLSILIQAGCSGAISNSIISSMPSCDNNPQISNSNYENFDSPALFGAYTLDISRDIKTAELNPLRTPSIGESYLVNGMRYFNVTPCSTCLKIKSISVESGHPKLTFSITHPFEPGNPSQPPTAKNRLDLNLFDTAMIIVPVGSIPSTYSSVKVYDKACVNQAGFTRELQNITGDTAGCPYFLLVDDSMSGISTFNKFAMGTHDKTFDVWFSDVGTYNLYLTMSYGASAKKADRLNPKYYNPEFNRKAAWKVKVIPPEGTNPPTLGNTWDSVDHSTQYNVTVDVYDWQINATVNPSLTNTTDIYAKSGVKIVYLEIPGMTSTPASVITPTGGTGKSDSPLEFRIPIANANGLPAGTYSGLVKVVDDRTPSNPITDRDYMIDPRLSSPITNITPTTLTFDAEDVSIDGSFAYVASVSSGFKVVDISDPKTAHVRGSLSMSNLTCVDASGNYAYVCDNQNLKIIDVSNPDLPSVINQVPSLNSPGDLTVSGGYAYVQTAGGMVIIDVDPPGSASLVKGVITVGVPLQMAIANGYAYLTTRSGSSGFLEIISVDPPASAHEVSQTALIFPAGGLWGIHVSGELAYITGQRALIGYQNELLIVDVDPPETPLNMKTVYLPELATCIDINSGFAYIGGVGNVDLVDISPYGSAHLETAVKIPTAPNSIETDGNYFYVADKASGLKIYTLYIPPEGTHVNYVIPEYATYQTFTATVVPG